MSTLEVLFELPEWIARGLESGAFQRVGGVIVDAASRQVVAWLRDGTVLDTVTDTGLNLASAVASPLSIIMSLGRTAFQLWDGHLTREAVNAVGQQVATVAAISSFTAAGQVVDLALSAATLYRISRRLDKLSEEVAKLSETIRAEFAQNRDMRFKVALQAARDVFETNNTTYRDGAVRSAIDGLFEAREQFLTEFQKTMKGELTYERLLAAQHFLIRALYAELSRIRCYLATNDLQLAKQRLVEDKPIFKEKSQLLIKAWLGKSPAAFFHKDIPPQDLERFIQVQRWLYEDNSFSRADDMKIMFKIINDLRPDFWNAAVLQDDSGDLLKQVTAFLPLKRTNEQAVRLASKLAQAEVIIENYQRLEGFELELRSMRLSFDEWRDLVKDDDIQKHGIGIIVDSEAKSKLRPASKKLQ